VDVRLYGPVDLVVVEEEEDDKEGDGEESGPFGVGIDAVAVVSVWGNPLVFSV